MARMTLVALRDDGPWEGLETTEPGTILPGQVSFIVVPRTESHYLSDDELAALLALRRVDPSGA